MLAWSTKSTLISQPTVSNYHLVKIDRGGVTDFCPWSKPQGSRRGSPDSPSPQEFLGRGGQGGEGSPRQASYQRWPDSVRSSFNEVRSIQPRFLGHQDGARVGRTPETHLEKILQRHAIAEGESMAQGQPSNLELPHKRRPTLSPPIAMLPPRQL